jgi:hypothetical protein
VPSDGPTAAAPTPSRGPGRLSAVGPGPEWRARTIASIALLAFVATAVALLLAQSAGAIHLGFLGPAA